MSRFGNITLGRDDEEPEFKTVSWVAMMFSAGMGIGLMFYGVSEPISHFATPPPGTGAAGNPEATQNAMATTLFHWTLHPWAIYAVVGLAIAYGVYRKGRLQLISAAFEPLLGQHANGPGARSSTCWRSSPRCSAPPPRSGLGALQIRSGLNIVERLERDRQRRPRRHHRVLTVAFVLSAVSGVAKGIQWLSNINMVLAVVLALFVFVVGPTVFILNLVPTSLGSYVQDLAMMSARTGAEGGETNDVASRLDRLLLGLVALVDAVRRHVHRPHLARPHDPPVRQRRAARAEPGQPGLVLHLRRRGHQAAADRHRHRRRRRRGVAAVHHAAGLPAGHRGQRPGDGPGRDLLRVRRRRRVHRDGHALRARHASSRASRPSSSGASPPAPSPR